MGTQRELEIWLQEGIVAAKDGNYEQARFRLLDVVEQDQTNETAWYWLYQVFDRHEDKRVCLENLITINPQNQWARQELLRYLPTEQPSKRRSSAKRAKTTSNESRPLPISYLAIIRIIAAFWLGISLIFLGGGIIAAGEWLVSALRSRTFPDYITVLQLFELFTAIIFIVVGVVGINVAIGLFTRSMIGFYGSLLFALTLLLIGPTISLIVTPPNYLVMVCTGGLSGMIAVLTLASQPGFKQS